MPLIGIGLAVVFSSKWIFDIFPLVFETNKSQAIIGTRGTNQLK